MIDTMKKIFNIFAFLAIATAFMACSDSENEIVDNSLKVVSSSLSFDFNGGDGFVEVDQAIVDATTTADWVSTKVDGKKVSFTVNPNIASRESRNAKLVIKSKESSVIVAVSQNGFVFNSKSATDISTDNNASTQFVPVIYKGTLNIVECPSWIKATVQEDGISLALDKNDTGKLRSGSVVFSAGDFEDQITVTQFDAKENLLGTYYLTYYTSAGEEDYLIAEIGESSIELPEIDVTIPAKFDFTTNTITFTGMSACGTYGPYSLFTLVYSEQGLTLSEIPCSFKFVYDAEYGDFVAEGSASFVIGAFASAEPTVANYAGSLVSLNNPFLLKK